ncbi:hypothetical protein LTR56_015463 [Elasticomyces elasticus]|nr:hypothetical protein LTR22_022639 [Elasticomyces elasticus]KAK3634117.1 hypothetical protein LTR56_015463 [Elasticomyces elasticus]KAK5754890.1 hypothetical protein LTS12_015013 [Elasticomyces elasticus]
MGATITRKVSINKVTKAIINCFGLPSVSAATAVEALESRLWKSLGSNLTLAFAESLQLVGTIATIFVLGIPVWAVSGGPTRKTLGLLREIRGYSQHVHREIKALVPRHSVYASMRAETVRQAVEAIFSKYEDWLMEDGDLLLELERTELGSEDGDSLTLTDSLDGDSTLCTDVKEAKSALAELGSKGTSGRRAAKVENGNGVAGKH